MTFDEILAQILDLRQRQRRVSCRVLKRCFAIDDDCLEALKVEIIKAQRLAMDKGLWTKPRGMASWPRCTGGDGL